ncbi:MAG: UdgX family uracil-DNA binding protein [Burkholderiales bacterium]
MSTSTVADPPHTRSLPKLRRAAASCRACPLWRTGTQTVFGEGGDHAALLVVGEQPGDREDIEGHPFVGPAGRLLDRALEATGVPRTEVYITNAVKHFKWEPRGKRRLHKTPAQREIEACLPWLEAEIGAVDPRVILCMGATAARSVMGGKIRVTEARGQPLRSPLDKQVVITIHPAYILRLRTGAEEAFSLFVNDVAQAAALAGFKTAVTSDE